MRSDQVTSGARRTTQLHAVLVGAVALAAYVNTFLNDFCYDDVLIVRDSALVNAPGKSLDIWTSDYWREATGNWSRRDLLYRPATVASFRTVRTAFGASPLPQHLVNILLHAAVSVLVLKLALAIGLSARVGLASGLLFAVLPIHVEAVAAVVGRADLLAALGVLTALLVGRRSGILAKTATVFSVFVAMSSKESGIAVVPILFFWEWLIPRDSSATAASPGRNVPGSNRGKSSFSARWLPTVAVCLMPLAGYLAFRYVALGAFWQQPAPSRTINALVDVPTWQRVLGVFQLVGKYVQKTLWPDVLCVSYAINAVRPASSLADWGVVVGIFALVGGIVGSAVSWHRGRRSMAFLFGAALLAYAPTANAFVLIQVFFAERIWYLPSIFVCVAIALSVDRLLAHRLPRTIGLMVLVGMMFRGWVRNSEWRDNGTLFASCYRDHPESIACLNHYGGWLVDHGDVGTGVKLLTRAIEMDLGFTDAQRALGRAYLKAGDFQRAVERLQIADMQVPGHPPTVAALTTAQAQLNANQGDRVERLRLAADASPPDLGAELAYVEALLGAGRREEALTRFEQREGVFGNAVAWEHQYAVTLVLLDRLDAAIDRYRHALRLDERNAPVSVELAMLLLERRAGDDLNVARRLCDRAVNAAPNDPSAHVCCGEAAALRGDVAGAQAAYRKAISLLPADHPQRRILEQRAKTLGG